MERPNARRPLESLVGANWDKKRNARLSYPGFWILLTANFSDVSRNTVGQTTGGIKGENTSHGISEGVLS